MTEIPQSWIVNKALTNPQLSKAERGLSRQLTKVFNQALFMSLQELRKIGELDEESAAKISASINGVNADFNAEMLMSLNRTLDHPFDPEEILATHVFEASARTIGAMQGDIMRTIGDGYRKGMNPRVVAQFLKKDFLDLRTHELERIARTEMHGAQNKASTVEIESQGLDYKKWVAKIDDRTRAIIPEPNHIAMNGQIVRANQSFSNGLMYPGDRTGQLNQWINCRCRVVPYFMLAGKMPPPGQQWFYEHELVNAPTEKKPVVELKSKPDIPTGLGTLRNFNKNVIKIQEGFPEEQIDAFGFYQGNAAFEINEALRNANGQFGRMILEVDDYGNRSQKLQQIRNLDKAFTQSSAKLQEDLIVYRGIEDAWDSDLVKALTPGTEFTDKAFVSTTISEQVAEDFAGVGVDEGEGVIMAIKLKAGQTAIPLGGGEFEMLLPRDTSVTPTTFKVISREVVDNVLRLILEII